MQDPLCAVAYAYLTAITAAVDQSMMRIQVESDSLVLVKTLKSTEYDHSLGGILSRESKFILST